MKHIFKILFLLIALNSQMLFAESDSAKADRLYNEAQRLYNQKNYINAIALYHESYNLRPEEDAAQNLGSSYDKIKDYDNAISWYKVSANQFNNTEALYNLGLDYKRINNIQKSIKWYKKAIEKGDLDSYDNISLIYHDIKKDNLTASAYYIATIGKSYTKKEILDFLKDDWKIDEATIKKAYQLQKSLVPDPYYDKEFEDKVVKRKTGRR